MDMSSCVARRTRSKTESNMISILNKSKGIPPPSEDLSVSVDARAKRAAMRNSRSPLLPKPKRRRKEGKEDDDDVVFIGTNYPEATPMNSPKSLGSSPIDIANLRGEEEDTCPNANESKSVDSDRVSESPVDVVNLTDDNELQSVDSDRVGDSSVDVATDDNESKSVDCDLDDVSKGEEENASSAQEMSDSDEVVSINDDSVEELSDDKSSESDSDEDFDDPDSSDYMEESSDSTYSDSSESDFVCSEDEEEAGGVTDIAKGTKSSGEKVYSKRKRVRSRKENDLNVIKLLTEAIWKKKKVFEDEILEENDDIVKDCSSEKVGKPRKFRSRHRVKERKNLSDKDSLDFESFDTPPLNLRFGCEEPEEPIEKTEEEKEIDILWEQMALALKLEEIESTPPAKRRGVTCLKGSHDFFLDEEIGLKCCHCSYVSVEIKNISPAMEKCHANVNDKKKSSQGKMDQLPNGLDFESLDRNSYDDSLDNTQGTVWKYIPGVKDSLYPHQQEGFEFIWNNLAGTTKLDELKSFDVREGGGGCVISHSPGTGKTRLTIVFLQSYLQRFPDSHPVVIAPASLLLTWEEEFKKWSKNIPFYNLNSQEFSGDEDQSAVSILKGNKQHKHSVRMIKMYSWMNKKSVLGVSYSLYEKLAGNKPDGEIQEFRRMLLELPGLLVLDEGHTPRNQSSCIWKVLSEVKTEKRIILSGTPFQNNFKELSNVLCLARPAYTDTISSRLQDLSKWNQEGKKGGFYEETGIVELRAMIAPFVHVHKGNILRESLPGLKDCVVVLNPPYQQKKILDRIDTSQNTFELEHKLSAVSVHPSLYACCNPTKKEELLIGPATLGNLRKLRLDSKGGAKTRFLIDFIRFSETVKEKVLVFSQYIETLKLIMEQLIAVFGWTAGGEILFMYGQLEQKERQHLINNFNKPDSASKVLLASTKACSEGINLVGASRVVLLDVVWNPSVERQAISRAYRIGQKRVVYTYHLMIKGTSEWGKYQKQTKKHRMSELVFSPNNEEDKVIKDKVVSEDRILDEMVRHDKLKDMFEKIVYHPKKSDMFTKIL